MKYTTLCKKVNLNESSKEKMLKKFSKLEKFFNEDAEMHISISEQRDQLVVEATIKFHDWLLRAEERNADLLTAVERIVMILERQIRKNKTKLEKRLKTGVFDNYVPLFENDQHVEEEKEFNIIKTKKMPAKPMAAEEAILQMNLLGHDFFLFNNADGNGISLVYRRKDGNYGLMELD